MHILIDVQGLQSESKSRGIGRYTLELTRAIILNRGEHRISVLINGLYPINNINEVKSKLCDILPEHECYIFSGVSPTANRDKNNLYRSKLTQQCRELAIENISPDIVLVSSFFEGFTDNFTVNISKSTDWKTFVICYDLIPLLNKERYLCDPVFEQFYMNKLAELAGSDGLLAISESSRQEAIIHTGIPAEKVTNISSAASDSFRKIASTDEYFSGLINKLKLPKKFILALAMMEPRKNIETMVIAYSKLPETLRNNYQLVLAYNVNSAEKQQIIDLAKDNGVVESSLIFTGYLSDDELIAIYNLCTLFVFPSLHEGFGLPPLEAMKCGAATLSSNTTSLPEVMGWDQAMFDPTNPEDMSNKIAKALTDSNFYEQLKANAETQVIKFSWDLSATRAIDTMAKLVNNKTSSSKGFIFDDFINSLEISSGVSKQDYLKFAWSLVRNNYRMHKRKLLVDISVLVHHDAKTGIQRVSRSILSQLMAMQIEGYNIHPVYYTIGECYRYANKYKARSFGVNETEDKAVLFTKDDILLVADLTAHLFPAILPEIDEIRKVGVNVNFIVYDILPILHPEWCAESIRLAFPSWLEGIAAHGDQLICISESVANETRNWLQNQQKYINPFIKVSSFHLGADIDGSMPSSGLPDSATMFIKKMEELPTFLMVGTLEPRKGHEQTLAAFNKLWADGHQFQLCIIGKQGWNVEDLVSKINTSSEYNKHLFWLQDISDEYLELIYTKSCALIFASKGEGFGLPLIEAAQKNIPLIIRDIPVFREVVGSHAYYFKGENPNDISQAIIEWYSLYQCDKHPKSIDVKWLTWRQSVEQLLSKLPLIS
ncbi:TPA: glycosyltransferase family 4 protein [Kluyvera ascorbata]|uniref:Glycosyltransferase family 1 protein n=1 Tax=Kluyvera genomosp. 2 TaxID=2774054 RepID=A0A2T2XY65_9ENTR|nr:MULTISPECIES: glycosyltransferase family 1 protein [Enterobacteriaceae]HAT3920155.1 glycosyltransferase family 4 protein [Kluyvera ascorbata]PSR45244.1 glycosyltransferase family 1 protein [Kluyvera genomosp. 2]BBQ83222.1 glycosyl transferase family 1 [Klebsiella sp. WP3-W18-ESBL-02]BBR20316.1 glycosyl transferase family 1 [Klebsiella sp. WP3-S18-ESBL-05]HAT3945064.1 glycosyltransferase family 4 protein [Kluyvera ascorbata]